MPRPVEISYALYSWAQILSCTCIKWEFAMNNNDESHVWYYMSHISSRQDYMYLAFDLYMLIFSVKKTHKSWTNAYHYKKALLIYPWSTLEMYTRHRKWCHEHCTAPQEENSTSQRKHPTHYYKPEIRQKEINILMKYPFIILFYND